MALRLKEGDLVVYRVTKHSHRPGPRAQEIEPSRHGENYRYEVDKYWVVDSLEENDQVVLRTRRGKLHRRSADDQRLRRARFWERWWLRARFPAVPGSAEMTVG